MTKSISLDERDEAFIAGQLASGRYSDPSEVVHDALRLMEEREHRRAALDAAIERGLADVKAGKVKPLEEVAERLIAKYRAMAEERGA